LAGRFTRRPSPQLACLGSGTRSHRHERGGLHRPSVASTPIALTVNRAPVRKPMARLIHPQPIRASRPSHGRPRRRSMFQGELPFTMPPLRWRR
jgi:hypothetical protein